MFLSIIQQLHIDLNNTKENSVTYEDFKDKKIVLIAHEAHPYFFQIPSLQYLG